MAQTINKPVTVSIRVTSVVLYTVGLVVFGSLAVQFLTGYLEKLGHYQALGLLFVLIMMFPVMPLLRIWFLIPFKMIITDERLTTYSLLGKHEIALSAVANVAPVFLMPTSLGSNIMGLKITDSSGAKVFVQLGTLSWSKRPLLSLPLARACGAYIAQDGNVRKIWENWLRTGPGITFFVSKK